MGDVADKMAVKLRNQAAGWKQANRLRGGAVAKSVGKGVGKRISHNSSLRARFAESAAEKAVAGWS